ncbi:PLP-dependent aminotransferase family protein [Brevibacillus ruminantium]|uniref:PLP-dependent aminotransferase family protein n=1 Tax=Brevibacillus ruminantium TaxID=2950604 RepID=A0ABY4WID6_9BACL|nr:PLP-dependent aminotransferase family protein [Brevibacillus ruminantium]USG65605.1 PLP-dependent aminotransferase family protein [Brevibacillus ruminantium]
MSSTHWDQIVLDAAEKVPLYKQISQQIEQLVHEGKLKPGTRLPSERRMAELLKVSRMTITLANEEMKARGVVRSQQGSGTFIMRGPRIERTEQVVTWQTSFAYQTGNVNHAMEEIMRFGRDPRLINFAGVGTAPEIHPGIELSQCFAEHLRKNPILLQLPAPTQGYEPLRMDAREWLLESEIEADPQEIMIVSGAMQGLDLISRLFLAPGDYVIMEDPGFLAASDAFSATGAKILRITLDEEGIRIDSLENLLMQFPVKFIYVNPTFHNPTGVTMSLQRRKDLLALAKKYRVPIIEDDPFSLLYFGKKPVPPLKALDRDDYVIYLQSFSKYLYPGLRVALLVAPEGIISSLSKIKQRIDLHSNNLTQIAVHAFLTEGRLLTHTAKLRQAYAARLELIQDILKEMPEIRCKMPEGGVFLWCKIPSSIRAERMLQFALQKGVSFVPGNWTSGVGLGENYLRMAFTQPSIELVKKGFHMIRDTISEYH